jgi:hypothetical protein
VKDTTRHAYLESFIVALKNAREDWVLSSLNVISEFGNLSTTQLSPSPCLHPNVVVAAAVQLIRLLRSPRLP